MGIGVSSIPECEVDFQLVIQEGSRTFEQPKFVSSNNDILFEKRDYQTKRPPIVSPLLTLSPLVVGLDGSFFRTNEFVWSIIRERSCRIISIGWFNWIILCLWNVLRNAIYSSGFIYKILLLKHPDDTLKWVPLRPSKVAWILKSNIISRLYRTVSCSILNIQIFNFYLVIRRNPTIIWKLL